jgi:hypothetical protein
VDHLHRLEAALAGATGLCVLAVAALVALPPRRSGVPDVTVASALATQEWLGAERIEACLRRGPVALDLEPKELARPAHVDPSAPPAPEARTSPPPWVPHVPGAVIVPPRRVPEALRRHLSALEPALEVAQEGGGRFVGLSDGRTAYELTHLEPDGLLSRHVGLRAGDRLVEVNGRPLGQSVAAGRALYEALREERRFWVTVLRGGRTVVLTVEVQ